MLKIESIGSSAFLGTKSLTDIKIPGKGVDILPNAFQSSGLEKFDINASTIYSYDFKYSLLKEITLPVSVKSVGTDNQLCFCYTYLHQILSLCTRKSFTCGRTDSKKQVSCQT